MQTPRYDFSIFQKFNFEYKPVGIKFLLNKPKNLEMTDKIMPMCRLFSEAQNSPPFYAGKNNFSCVDRLIMGMMTPEPVYESGQIGAREKIYQEARANARIYRHIQKISPGIVRYVAFAGLDSLTFDPDVLVITASPSDADVLFRALSFSTGKPLTAKITPVLSCAWIFVYPYLSGEMNFTITGVGYGIKAQKILPEGLLLISVPFDMIPMLIDNLSRMDWELPIHSQSQEERSEFAAGIMEEIFSEYSNG